MGYSVDIQMLYEEAYKTALKEAPYSQQTLAGIVNYLIGMMYSLERNNELSKNTLHMYIVSKAQMKIRDSLEKPLSIQEIAGELASATPT